MIATVIDGLPSPTPALVSFTLRGFTLARGDWCCEGGWCRSASTATLSAFSLKVISGAAFATSHLLPILPNWIAGTSVTFTRRTFAVSLTAVLQVGGHFVKAQKVLAVELPGKFAATAGAVWFIWIIALAFTFRKMTPLLKAFDYSSELTNWSAGKPTKAFLMCTIVEE